MLSRITIAVTEAGLQEKLSKLLKNPDTVVESLKDHRRFWKKISRKTCDLVVVSSDLIQGKALDEIHSLRQLPNAPLIVVLSEETSDQQRAHFISAGCDTILNPTLSNRKLGSALNAILSRQRKVSRPILAVRPKLAEADIGDFVAESPAMSKFIKILPRVAKSDSSVLILGETGVGKERLAHALHAESPRNAGPFIAIHCGALPESLLESELFGHEQGAFTGATKARRGCFELAHQGTTPAKQAAAYPRKPRNTSRRERKICNSRCPYYGSHKPRSRSRSPGQAVPPGLVLSFECSIIDGAAAS